MRNAIIQTFTGKMFDLLNPTPEMVDIEDIAHSLAGTYRYNNHTRVPYSVAQHSLFVMKLCQPKDYLCALLHDSPEAYIGDVVGPLKAQLPYLRIIEQTIWAVVCQKFAIPVHIPESVLLADKVALATEKRDLMAHDLHWEFLTGVEPSSIQINPWPFEEVKRRFLYTVKVLMERR